MTAGIPGAGIGGIFYLLTALLAPVWMAVCYVTGRQRDGQDWRLAARHCAMALTILAAIWAMGLALGRLLRWRPVAMALPGAPMDGVSVQVLGAAMVYLSLATLATVLLGVEVLRLVVRRHSRASVLLAVGIASWVAASPVNAQGTKGRRQAEVQSALARADKAYSAEDWATAERAYDEVLAIDPDQSRALFRKARLLAGRDLDAAAGYYRHYAAVEPADAWGHLALADAEARLGNRAAAEQAYAAAARLAPAEADVVLGQPRMHLALGDLGRAVEQYEAWLRAHPRDADVLGELAGAYQRARWWPAAVRTLERAVALRPGDPRLARRLDAARLRAAPAITAGLLAVGETDVTIWGPAASADVSAGDRGRIGGQFRRRRVSSFDQNATSDRLGATITARPLPDLQLDAGVSGVWLRPTSGETTVRPEFSGRLRRAPAVGLAGVDLRALHGPLDLTPDLVADPVIATQLSGAVDVPVVGAVRARAQGRYGRLTRHDERNTRTGVGGGPVVRLADGVRVSGQFQQIRNSLPTATGYFAPERADLIDGGVELEREFDNVSVAIDAGAGVQRVRKAGEPMGGWGRALRLWSFAAWSVAPGRQVLVEFEAYDSQVATIVQTADKWRHASVTVSFRAALGH